MTRLLRLTLSEALTILACAGMAFGACRAPQPPATTGDTLKDLALAIEAAEIAAPYARAACAVIPDDTQRAYCDGSLDAIDEAVLIGRQLLDTASECQDEQDEECMANALETANKLLRVLRPQHAAPEPSGSAP